MDVGDTESAAALPDHPAADRWLVRRAMELLEGNWLGHATRPSPSLYPHQWSWDTAFVAIGYAHYDQLRAQEELRSLFRGQWSNGMLPHIVFSDHSGDYFPGPDFWQTESSPFAPRRPLTSGIVQPPVQATAALHIYRHASDPPTARSFLGELLPKLASWHTYLYREADRSGDGLVEIWHPWASGMDNSPLWDSAIDRLSDTAEIPIYRRRDTELAAAAERPTSRAYDYYVYLVKLFRERAYHPDLIRAVTPFAVYDVLYNSLLVQANRDLAEICRIVGADPTYFERWADKTAAAIESRLWEEEHSTYFDLDLVAGQPLTTRVGPAFAPLYAGVPSQERAERVIEALLRHRAIIDESTWAIPSVSPHEVSFTPNNYWRGPIWINVNWFLYHGLRRYGRGDLAAELRRAMIDLPKRSGFYEHFNPLSGQGQGESDFSWTASLVLNLLFERESVTA
jgi:hypothetical protein